jgi:hypothetical protein
MKRYELTGYHAIQSDTGEWVRASDALAEIAELKARLAQTEEDRQHYATKYADMLAAAEAARAT